MMDESFLHPCGRPATSRRGQRQNFARSHSSAEAEDLGVGVDDDPFGLEGAVIDDVARFALAEGDRRARLAVIGVGVPSLANRSPRVAATSTGMTPVPTFSSLTVTFQLLPLCGLLRFAETIFGNDDLEKPLMGERIKGGRDRRRTGASWPESLASPGGRCCRDRS